MSEALTEDAPPGAPAATSVEDLAPGDDGTVDAGSAGADVVSAKRFNGLMARYNQDKATWEKQFQEMQSQLESLQRKPEETTSEVDGMDDSRVQALVEQQEALLAELQKQSTENTKAQVLEKYPEAKAFADLITGETAEDFEEVAKTISERFKALTGEEPAGDDSKGESTEGEPKGESEGSEPSDGEPPSPPPGGGVEADLDAPRNEVVQNALKEGNWEAYWTAKTSGAGEKTSSLA